jgi:hypothetical protein
MVQYCYSTNNSPYRYVYLPQPPSILTGPYQGVTRRFRLSWLTNSALVYEPKCGGRGEVAGSQPMSTAVHMELKETL